MGIIYKPRGTRTENIEDIVCDVCGKSTLDNQGMNYEHSEFMAEWGYCSKKDGEGWDYFLCEAHSDLVKEFIEILKIGYNIDETPNKKK